MTSIKNDILPPSFNSIKDIIIFLTEWQKIFVCKDWGDVIFFPKELLQIEEIFHQGGGGFPHNHSPWLRHWWKRNMQKNVSPMFLKFFRPLKFYSFLHFYYLIKNLHFKKLSTFKFSHKTTRGWLMQSAKSTVRVSLLHK